MKVDYYAIDFETANNDPTSACSIGIVGVYNRQIVLEDYYLINPDQVFLQNNIDIHHITPFDVRNEPRFFELWDKIYHYFDGTIIVAHNARFDLQVLYSLVKKYNLKTPNIKFMCTYEMSTICWPDEVINHRLNTLAAYIGEQFTHHQALSDAMMCAKLCIRMIQMNNSYSIEEATYRMHIFFGIFNNQKFHFTFKGRQTNYMSSSKYSNKVIAFVDRHPRKKELVQKMLSLGAIIVEKNLKPCDYIIALNNNANKDGLSPWTKIVRVDDILEELDGTL